MGDFQPGRGIARLGPTGATVSDIDFIAVTSRPLNTAAIRALHRVDRRLAAAPWRAVMDGIYLTRGDLAHDPGEVRGRPHSHGGRVTTGGSGDPVRWQEFAQHGIAMRGPHRSTVPVRIDRKRLVSWVRGNLNQYWRQWHASCARPLSWRGVVSLTPWASVWGVLGVSRLHYTLRTGRICSKSPAAIMPTSSGRSGIRCSRNACGSAQVCPDPRSTPTRQPVAKTPSPSCRW